MAGVGIFPSRGLSFPYPFVVSVHARSVPPGEFRISQPSHCCLRLTFQLLNLFSDSTGMSSHCCRHLLNLFSDSTSPHIKLRGPGCFPGCAPHIKLRGPGCSPRCALHIKLRPSALARLISSCSLSHSFVLTFTSEQQPASCIVPNLLCG